MGINVTPAPVIAYRWRDYDDRVAFRKLRAAANMKERSFKRAYGPDGRGLIQFLLHANGSSRFHDVGLIYRGGVVRAVRTGPATIDLDNPRATPPELRRIYQPGNLNAALTMAGIAEEAGVSTFADPNEAWCDAARTDGIDRDEALAIAKKVAARCNAALMAELYRGVTPAEAPLYAALRALPPSLRHRCGWLADPSIEYEFRARGAQLLGQLPLMALVWSRIQQAATASGSKLKDVADELGFPRSSTRIPAAALSVINFRLDIDGRDEEATAEELAPIDDALCSALPHGSFRGKLVIDLAILAASRGLPPEDASGFGRWAAPHIAKLSKESELQPGHRVLLADYRAANAETLDEAGGVEPWCETMTLRDAIDGGLQLVWGLAEARSIATSDDAKTWASPAWSLGEPQPPAKGRGWFLFHLGSHALLRWAGAEFHNCSATYAARCAAGSSSIYAVLRRPIKGDKPSSIIELPGFGPVVRGAMLELRQTPAGKARRAQLSGVANAPEASLPSSLTRSVRRWIAGRNDPRNAALD